VDRQDVRRAAGPIHFWLTLIFFNMILLRAALPRASRHAAAHSGLSLMFETWNKISSIGAFGMGSRSSCSCDIVLKTIRSGAPAPQRPWEGADSLDGRTCRRRFLHTFEDAGLSFSDEQESENRLAPGVDSRF